MVKKQDYFKYDDKQEKKHENLAPLKTAEIINGTYPPPGHKPSIKSTKICLGETGLVGFSLKWCSFLRCEQIHMISYVTCFKLTMNILLPCKIICFSSFVCLSQLTHVTTCSGAPSYRMSH